MINGSAWDISGVNSKPNLYYYEFIDFVIVNRISKTFVVHLKNGDTFQRKYVGEISPSWEVIETRTRVIYCDESNQDLTA